MAGNNLSDSASRDAVADYLAAVTAQLTGPPAARAAVTDELRDGLLEALETHQGRGCSQAQATAAAIAEFGDPDTVAAAFGPELAALQARRLALGLLATGPLVGLAWVAAVAVNALPPWRHQLTGLWLALPLVGLALAVAGPALGLTVAATAGWAAGSAESLIGRPSLRPPRQSRPWPPWSLTALALRSMVRMGQLAGRRASV
jgi:hypothetical protein